MRRPRPVLIRLRQVGRRDLRAPCQNCDRPREFQFAVERLRAHPEPIWRNRELQ